MKVYLCKMFCESFKLVLTFPEVVHVDYDRNLKGSGYCELVIFESR